MYRHFLAENMPFFLLPAAIQTPPPEEQAHIFPAYVRQKRVRHTKLAGLRLVGVVGKNVRHQRNISPPILRPSVQYYCCISVNINNTGKHGVTPGSTG